MKCLYAFSISFIAMNIGEKSQISDKSWDLLKEEYQICRNKIDDLDNFLKDIRFKGITVITCLIAGDGVLFNMTYYEANIIVSISTILLILELWKYDHKYNMFLVGAVQRAQEIEDKLQERLLEDIGKVCLALSIDRFPELENKLNGGDLPKELRGLFKASCSAESEGDGNKKTICQKLRDMFKTKKRFIHSKNASEKDQVKVSVLERNIKWKIIDEKNIYIIKKDKGMLNTYRGVKMISYRLTDVYRKLPGDIAITSSSFYGVLFLIVLGILLYSTHLFYSTPLNVSAWIYVPIIIMSIIFIILALNLWCLRNEAEDLFRSPIKNH